MTEHPQITPADDPAIKALPENSTAVAERDRPEGITNGGEVSAGPIEVAAPSIAIEGVDKRAANIERAITFLFDIWPFKDRVDVWRKKTDPVTGIEGASEGATFQKTERGRSQARRWFGERKDYNHYFCPNIINPEIILGETQRDGKTIHKVKESDIVGVVCAPLDLDPSSVPAGVDAKPHYDTERQRRASELMADERNAVVICSGGGAQGFKIYSEPVTDPTKFEDCKARNVAFGELTCQSLDHLFRVPGMPNIPNVTKRNAGRVEVTHSYLLRNGTRRIDPATAVINKVAAAISTASHANVPGALPGKEEVAINRALVVLKPVEDFETRVSPTGKLISEHGGDLPKLNAIRAEANSLNKPYDSNSAMGNALICTLNTAGYSAEEIAGHMLDPNNPTGKHYRDQGDGCFRAVGRSIYKARLLEQELANLEALKDSVNASVVECTPLVVRNLMPVDGAKIPKRDWLIENLLLRGQVTHAFGPGGTGKSLFCLAIATACALNIDWLGYKSDRRVKVLILNAEDDFEELQRRLWANWQKLELNDREMQILDGYLLTIERSSFSLVELNKDGQPERTSFYNELQRYVKDNDIGLLVTDPLSDPQAARQRSAGLLFRICPPSCNHDARCHRCPQCAP
jgi:AAA domain